MNMPGINKRTRQCRSAGCLGGRPRKLQEEHCMGRARGIESVEINKKHLIEGMISFI